MGWDGVGVVYTSRWGGVGLAGSSGFSGGGVGWGVGRGEWVVKGHGVMGRYGTVAYPLPVLSGRPPSDRAIVSVRAWSANTRYAMSIPSVSAAPTCPVYDRQPVAWKTTPANGQ